MSQPNNHPKKKTGLAKYRSLIILATSFFALVALLSGITFFASQKLANATKEFELASQQTVIVQQISKNLLDLNLKVEALGKELQTTTSPAATQTTENIENTEHLANLEQGIYPIDTLPQSGIYQLAELETQTAQFTETLKTLKEGGTLNDINGTPINIAPVTDPELQTTLDKIETIWTPYLGLMEHFIRNTKEGSIKKQTSDYLVDYVRLYNTTLQAETLSFSSRQNALIQYSANQLRLLQIAGISLAFLLFLAIVFGSLRQLARTDAQLAVAKQQTDDIMKTVNEGLFLVNKDLVIADQYSAKLEQILHQKNIAGRTLYDILEGTISQKDMETTKLFVEQLYNTWVVEELIQDLNPLKQVLVSYLDENGIGATQFLEFNFLRVMDEKEEQVDSVFVSVVDVTKEVHLQSQMQKDKEQHNRQIEMISYLLSIDNKQLIHFLSETKARIERMNNVLKNRGTDNLRDKAQQLYRETHSLKGDASAVNLSALVDIATQQEEKLKALLMHSNLKGNDFLPFTVGLDEMVNMMSFIENLVQRLNLQNANVPLADLTTDGQSTHTHSTAPAEDYWQNYFKQYAHDIADRQAKQVSVSVTGFDVLNLEDKKASALKDIAVQLLKNAIVHGIESSEERRRKGKDGMGHISLALENSDNELILKVKDDGAGINWEKLREKAVQEGLYTPAEAANLQSKALLRLMFKSGLSTADKQDEDAGRGVGMDIVKTLANEIGGRIGVNSRSNQFTQISVSLPK
ncbi:MAG: ATP-binding protein [Moraxella sp.]|nr:ATP-binding protein [Moraxella sp.]